MSSRLWLTTSPIAPSLAVADEIDDGVAEALVAHLGIATRNWPLSEIMLFAFPEWETGPSHLI